MDWANNNLGKNIQLFAHAQHIRQVLRGHSIKYFYNASNGNSKKYDEVKYFNFNWFRNQDGFDLSFNHGISPAQIINGSGWIDFASYYREYYALKKLLSKVEKLYISKNEHERFLHIVSAFNEKIELFDPEHPYPSMKSSCGGRILSKEPVIHPFSHIARLIQKPFISIARNRKHLYVVDWTNQKMVKEDPEALSRNPILPWKGYYYRYKDSYYKKADQIFPEVMGDFASFPHLKNVLEQINAGWDDSLISLCEQYIHKIYKKYRPLGLWGYAIWNELLDYYKPGVISVPAETKEELTLLIQIAKSMGIKTQFLGDGYPILPNEPFYKDEMGKNWLCDEFAGLGQAGLDTYIIKGVKPDQIKIIKPPLINNHDKLQHQKNMYDVIIMTWIPMHLNPESREEFGGQILVDVIRLLLEIGNKRIAVKIKSEGQREFYENILKIEGFIDKVTIISGLFYEHVLKTDFVIGGISTGVAEAFYHNIPYYIYEPYENGYRDAIIEDSIIIDNKKVARSLSQLNKHIQNNEIAIKVSRDYLFEMPLKK